MCAQLLHAFMSFTHIILNNVLSYNRAVGFPFLKYADATDLTLSGVIQQSVTLFSVTPSTVRKRTQHTLPRSHIYVFVLTFAMSCICHVQ
jgi:hypothetical protein